MNHEVDIKNHVMRYMRFALFSCGYDICICLITFNCVILPYMSMTSWLELIFAICEC